MTKEFIKYPSLIGGHKEKNINYHRFNEAGYWSDEGWYATEKVDGANFQFHYDAETGEVSVGSRNGWCSNGFFGSSELVSEMSPLVKLFCERILGPQRYATIYGKLFGGYWFGSKNSPVLQRVSYSLEKEFLAFDVLVDDTWLTREAMDHYFKFTDLKLVPIYKTGSFKELMEESPNFQSTIPGFLGNDLPEGNPENFSEGFVLRPYKDNYLAGPSPESMPKPFCIKIKGDKFLEKENVKKRKTSEVYEGEHPLLEELSAYVTKSRLESVISKEGAEPTSKTFGKFLGLMLKDIWQDAVGDEVIQENYKEIQDYKHLNKQLTGKVRLVILSKI